VKVAVYKRLFDLNAGFDLAIEQLARLSNNPSFNRGELQRYHALAKETRAAINSYLLEARERVETQEAGRRFGHRWEQERREE